MIKIAHKGNRNGPNPERENTWEYIQEALDAGYHVETDVSFIDGQFYIGHDEKLEAVSAEQLSEPHLWLHCKNIDAMIMLDAVCLVLEARGYPVPNFFWHQNDDYTITSDGWFWTFPGKSVQENCIAVMPEKIPEWDISKAAGVCSDYPDRYVNE